MELWGLAAAGVVGVEDGGHTGGGKVEQVGGEGGSGTTTYKLFECLGIAGHNSTNRVVTTYMNLLEGHDAPRALHLGPKDAAKSTLRDHVLHEEEERAHGQLLSDHFSGRRGALGLEHTDNVRILLR